MDMMFIYLGETENKKRRRKLQNLIDSILEPVIARTVFCIKLNGPTEESLDEWIISDQSDVYVRNLSILCSRVTGEFITPQSLEEMILRLRINHMSTD